MEYLKTWKNNTPDLPEINFDKNAQESFAKIKDLEPSVYKKLFSNQNLDELVHVLFPENATLELLSEHFQKMHQKNQGVRARDYKTVNNLCKNTINRIKNHST